MSYLEAGGSLKITIFAGDICDADAEVLCTSTNPRLTLAMGTGGAVRDRGGYGILRECERIVEAAAESGALSLPPGSVHTTSAGELKSRFIVHCVASDLSHRSSAGVIESCVRESLAKADAAGCTSIAMPVFAAGHASFGFARALEAMAGAVQNASTRVAHLIIVVYDSQRADEAATIVRSAIPGATVDIRKGPERNDEPAGLWSDEWH